MKKEMLSQNIFFN